MKYKAINLKNGIRLITITGLSTNAVTIAAYIRAGFHLDPIDKPGLSHFVEHMVFSGTKSFPSFREEAEAVERYGGWHTAYTWIEEQKHYAHISKGRFEEGLNVLLESIFMPLIKEEEIEKEKGVIKEEVLRNKADPANAIWNYVWFPLFFQDTPLARPYYGDIEDLDKISKADVDEFISNNFIPENMILLVAGDIEIDDIEEKIKKKVDKLLVNREIKTAMNLTPLKPFRKNKIVIHNDPSYYKTSIIIGVQTVDFSSKEKHVLNLIGDLIGGYFGTNLVRKLRDKGGLIYNWGVYQDNLIDTGYLAFNTSTAHENVLKVVKIILDEFQRLSQGKITKEEVNIAKGHLTGSLLANIEKGQDYIGWYGLQELLNTKKVLSIDEQIKIYKKIDIDTIKSTAAKYLTKENILIGLLGKSVTSEIEELLEN